MTFIDIKEFAHLFSASGRLRSPSAPNPEVAGILHYLVSRKLTTPAFRWYAGPLAAPLEAMFGTRTVVSVSGFMIGASFIIGSFTTSVIQLTFTLALLAGNLIQCTVWAKRRDMRNIADGERGGGHGTNETWNMVTF